MMSKKILSFLTLAAIVMTGALSGCATRIGDFTIVSTKNYEASAKYKQLGRMSGKDAVVIFGVPNLKNAVDRAIEAGNGVYLTNAVIEVLNYPFYYGYRVTGDVWAQATVSDLSNPKADLYELKVVDGHQVLTNGKVQLAIKQ